MPKNLPSALDEEFHLEKVKNQVLLIQGDHAGFAHYLEGLQEWFLNDVLSGKWEAGKMKKKAPWTCPRCSSSQGFQRRGCRDRMIISGSSRIKVKLYQVTCHSCRATFSPFPKLFGLEEKERIRAEALRRLHPLKPLLS